MGIKFRDDPDLQFLAHAKHEDLQILVDYLTKDKDGEKRYAQELLDEERFIGATGKLTKVWDLIAAELQLFGGDAIVNQLRGNGVLYKEVLCDVCSHLEVKFDKLQSAYQIEDKLIEKLLEKFWSELSLESRNEFTKEFGLRPDLQTNDLLTQLQKLFREDLGFSYRASVLLANSFAFALLGRGVGSLVGFGISRYLSVLAGPLGIAISALFTIGSISGPAYRVTIPCVMQIAYMRRALAKSDRY